MIGLGMNYAAYTTIDQRSSNRAVELLRRGAWTRALRFFEHSFWLRHGPYIDAPEPPWGCAYTTRRQPPTS